jgi:CRISPR-associated protein Csc2
VSVVFADGEIFSNLQLTQTIYDALTPEQLARTPLAQFDVLSAMQSVVPVLLTEDGVVMNLIMGERLSRLLQEVSHIASDEARLQSVLAQANSETNQYAKAYGVDSAQEKAKK